ncbi:epoxide hydrolase 1 (plasmid) [Rhizobium grahamii]|uniref:Epoxide hydrolase 1 n=1 Tax=Rhizobium grahamii TaxID=1120045 RepID=A0A5Q0CB18_9HYPH|nr:MULTISPECIES: epoxide hydrolase [Rhizobium]QFY62545.1 epoxide hydrolase 1 [Rhizobium grahamii]QRM52713.1 epoxide hydrolase 1 [Rhizobium sp. BG6]
MTSFSLNINRRNFMATAAIAGAATVLKPAMSFATAAASDEIRPFKVNVPDSAIQDLKQRIANTRWPAKENVSDDSQGLQLERLRNLVDYWGTDYDWRKIEAKLNSLPMFITEIDGLDIHFIHVRSKHENALPLIMTHGWPGSVLEMLKVIDPLTNPTAHGGTEEDAFHLVVPSIPGFGFSGKPAVRGWGSDHIGRAWATLMQRLGYEKYVSQGGDCGSVISERMAHQNVPGLLGIHLNMPAVVPKEIVRILAVGDPAPATLDGKEKAAFDKLAEFYRDNAGYAQMMVTRPQTIGYSLDDTPVGMAAWMYDKFVTWTYSNKQPEKVLTRDEMLDDISLYWFTQTGTSAAQIYWEDKTNNFNALGTIPSVPVAVSVFPGEIFQAPKSWTERAFGNLIYFNEVNDGGHFAAWEAPDLFTKEVRAAFRSLRSA